MSDMASLRARLKRAGSTKHARPPQPAALRHIPAHWAGHTASSSRGDFYYLETSYAPGHQHGRIQLGALARQAMPESTLLGFQPRGTLDSLVFLHTATTGLSGGAGTFAFLVGLGRLQGARSGLRHDF